jgi:uncharacterized Fe-S cluster-containing radical SAM superfamily protein
VSRFTGTDRAPYWRFRPLHVGHFHEWLYVADVIGCNWTCDRCWSKFGFRTHPVRYELSADELARKLAAGVERNDSDAAVITGGEPGLYWSDHIVPAISRYQEITGAAIEVETSGAVLRPEQLRDLDRLAESGRVLVVFGLKATSYQGLAEITGLPVEVARRAHERQLTNLLYAEALPNIGAAATFIDAFTDEGMYAAIASRMERQPIIQRYANVAASRFYTPKRHRAKGQTDGNAETSRGSDS